MTARWSAFADSRIAGAVAAAVDLVALARIGTLPAVDPVRGPALVLGLGALVSALVGVALPRERHWRRVAAVAQVAFWIDVCATWTRLGAWTAALLALGIGAADAALAKPEERSLAGVAIGGAVAIAWNAWRFGAPAGRVFAVALCGAIGAAAMRGRAR